MAILRSTYVYKMDSTEAQHLIVQAKKHWEEMIDSDPFYEKSALMISSQLKDYENFLSVPKEVPGIDNTEILEDFREKVDYNLQDHKGKSAFILACQQDKTNEPKEDT